MRRSAWQVLVFALALAVQVLGPAAASLAMARGAQHGRGIEICAPTSDGPQDPKRRAAHDHHGSCLLCQLCCNGVAPSEAKSQEFGKASVQWTAWSWTAADRASPAHRHGEPYQARAPPVSL